MMEIKNFADAMLKIAALNDKRVKALEDFRSGVDLINKINRLIDIRNQYERIANWLLINVLTKRYYTQEDQQLENACIEGIKNCNNEINKACSNYVTDKIQTELLSFLFGRN